MEKQRPFLTIFTPTFNRGEMLRLLYQDLLKQTNKNFVWLVIDDGSTDDTELFFKQVIREAPFEIRYIKKENGGKHTAYNLACQLVDTELFFVAMDSDDRLKEYAVKEIERVWLEWREDDSIKGFVFLCENAEGRLLYTRYDDRYLKLSPSWQEAYLEGWFWGEAEYVFRKDYVKKFRYPEYCGEKFFNEAYTYLQMTEKLLWSKESIYIREYQLGGLTDVFLKSIYKSPLGYAEYHRLKGMTEKRITKKTKCLLFYNVFSLLGGKKKLVQTAGNPILSVILLPIAYIMMLVMKIYIGKQVKT